MARTLRERRLVIRITADLVEEARALAERRGQTLSQLARQLLADEVIADVARRERQEAA
jgi:hypothetical protein